MMKSRVSVRLQLCRPPAHFFKEKVGSSGLATSNPDEKGQYEREEDNLRLAHVFFVILALHLVLVVGICLFFSYHTRAREVLQRAIAVSFHSTPLDTPGFLAAATKQNANSIRRVYHRYSLSPPRIVEHFQDPVGEDVKKNRLRKGRPIFSGSCMLFGEGGLK